MSMDARDFINQHASSNCCGLNQGSTVKLRFLQYVTKETRTNWELFQPYGAILL